MLLFASSHSVTFSNLLYDKVFAAAGISLLELLETEYFTHLPRSPELSKMTCACQEVLFLLKGF